MCPICYCASGNTAKTSNDMENTASGCGFIECAALCKINSADCELFVSDKLQKKCYFGIFNTTSPIEISPVNDIRSVYVEDNGKYTVVKSSGRKNHETFCLRF